MAVTFHSYANPTGRCVSCPGATPQVPACCDTSTPLSPDQSCPTSMTCAVAFAYCIRALQSTGTCSQSELMTAPAFVGEINFHNFTSRFFGLDNPLVRNSSDSWQVSTRSYIATAIANVLW